MWRAVLAACAMPSQLLYVNYLWTHTRYTNFLLHCLLPLNALPLLLAACREVRDAGGAGMLCAIAHVYMSRKAHAEGLRYI